MNRVRTALYLDFDNVFGGLLQLDPEAAVQFAENPDVWLERLTSSLTVDGPRRWLVLRCYMNPAGWVRHPEPSASSARLYFSRFRPFFTRAGFEVIDCPRLTHTKNAADIRMVLDAVDALSSETRYDEFVIASGDSDMTPLLIRLRAADRRTTIVSPSDAADAFTSVADRLVSAQEVLELVQDDLDEEEEAFERFRTIVTDRYTTAGASFALASLAHQLRAELGSAIDETNWFGHGAFIKAVESLALPGARFSNERLWDGRRHQEPNGKAPSSKGDARPDAVERLTALLNLPRLPRNAWPPVYRALADYASTHEFSLSEATRWSRDRLVEKGETVSRAAVGFVLSGAAHGGSPLYRQPPPDAAEIGAAFVANVLSRAEAAEISLTEDEVAAVRDFLGASSDAQRPEADLR